MKKTLGVVCVLFILFVFSGAAFSSSISVTGAVKQPLNLTMGDLARFEPVQVRLNEVTRDKNYHGAFNYFGVPLKTLFEFANIQKEETDFAKPIDLAIVVRNREGRQIVLSWGEVFYKNPAEIIIAFSATPIMPMRKCQDCHAPEVYQKWLEPLKRQIELPKLVVANDFYTDRSLEAVVNIEVMDLHTKMVSKKLPDLFSPQFSITGAVGRTLNISDISSYTRSVNKPKNGS